MKTFEISIQNSPESATYQRVDLNGFLDAHTVREFDQQMAQLLTSGATHIVLGLEGLNYISSAGVASLMGLMQRLRNQEGDLIIFRPSEKVFHVLRTLGFTNIFQIVENEKDLRKLPG